MATVPILLAGVLATGPAPQPVACTIGGPLAETVCALRAEKGDERDLRPEALFFEPSKVFFLPHLLEGTSESPTGRQDRLAIEVEFSEPIFPWQRRASAADRHFGGWTKAVAFTPMYRVRIWKEHSSPVRVPSFMPKATFQLHRTGPRAPGRQWGQRADDPEGVRRAFVPLTSLMVTVGHHSNGQDGCLYADALGVGLPKDACPAEGPAEIRINRLNGSFSTNYVQTSLFQALYRIPDAPDAEARARARGDGWRDERRAAYAWSGGLTWEWNIPVDFMGGAIEEGVRPIYGMNRFRVMVAFERFPGDERPRTQPRFRITAWGQLIDKSEDAADCGVPSPSDPSGRPCAPRLGWGADVSLGLGSAIDYLGAYARFFHGQDDYNLSFTHRKQNRFQAGLSFTPGRTRGPSFPTLAARVLAEEDDYERRGCSDAYRRFVRRAAAGATREGDAPTCPAGPR